jgi:hypothetical protein
MVWVWWVLVIVFNVASLVFDVARIECAELAWTILN